MASTSPETSYAFTDKNLETLALTHPSCHLETGDNQRLEFLGDAVLDIVIAEILYKKFPEADEGGLDRTRASIVNGESLALIARSIGLDQRIRLGESQRQHNPKPTKAMLEDCLEALIGAIYLDGGLDAAKTFIQSAFAIRLTEAQVEADQRNPKSKLQEWTQAHHQGAVPEYALVEAEGPDHKRRYHVSVMLDGKDLGRGRGTSIKAAESAAAAAALLEISENV